MFAHRENLSGRKQVADLITVIEVDSFRPHMRAETQHHHV